MKKAPSSTSPLPPFWDRQVHEDRRPFLLKRARIVRRLRDFFGQEGFLEVETPILQRSPGNETHLHAFATDLVTPQGEHTRLYLRTSPEFAAKKLLAAGETRIVEFAKVFRNRERGMAHHPEFTMVEWYRSDEPYEQLMEDCGRILALAADAGEVNAFSYRGRACDPFAAPERLTLVEAFARHGGMDLEGLLPAPGEDPSPAPFAEAAAAAGIRTAPDDGWADIFSRVLVERIEPQLGIGRPTILCEYPVSEAALARAKPSDPRFAERFELYACGLELANAFGELTDPAEQRRRFKKDMDEKARLYGERYPIDEDLIAALAVMPPSSGCALGLDRLCLLAAGARRIEDVLWAPVADPGVS